MTRRRKKIMTWISIIIIIFALLSINRIFYPDNVAATSPDHKDPTLRTRKYILSSSITDVTDTIRTIIPTLKTHGSNWRLINQPSHFGDEQRIVIKAEVPVFIFIDDLEVYIKADEAGREMYVDVRSASRV